MAAGLLVVTRARSRDVTSRRCDQTPWPAGSNIFGWVSAPRRSTVRLVTCLNLVNQTALLHSHHSHCIAPQHYTAARLGIASPNPTPPVDRLAPCPVPPCPRHVPRPRLDATTSHPPRPDLSRRPPPVIRTTPPRPSRRHLPVPRAAPFFVLPAHAILPARYTGVRPLVAHAQPTTTVCPPPQPPYTWEPPTPIGPGQIHVHHAHTQHRRSAPRPPQYALHRGQLSRPQQLLLFHHGGAVRRRDPSGARRGAKTHAPVHRSARVPHHPQAQTEAYRLWQGEQDIRLGHAAERGAGAAVARVGGHRGGGLLQRRVSESHGHPRAAASARPGGRGRGEGNGDHVGSGLVEEEARVLLRRLGGEDGEWDRFGVCVAPAPC